MFKKFALAAVAVATFSYSASAADLPVYKAAPAPVFNWTGAYIGITGGYGWGTTRWTNNAAVTTGDFGTDGGMIGGTIGYNWQARGSNLVFGIEGDWSWADISGTTTAACGTGCTSTVNWLATVRGRVGYAHNNFLLFASGGVAFADINKFIGGAVNTSQTEVGWTVGAGVEAALNRSWSAKVEYLFVSFDASDVFFAPTGIISNFNDIHIVRAGLNYRF